MDDVLIQLRCDVLGVAVYGAAPEAAFAASFAAGVRTHRRAGLSKPQMVAGARSAWRWRHRRIPIAWAERTPMKLTARRTV